MCGVHLLNDLFWKECVNSWKLYLYAEGSVVVLALSGDTDP